MRRISIKTIPHKDQRYPTAGDWYDVERYYENGTLQDVETQILVSELDNEDMEFAIGIHEAVEQYLCRRRGIPDKVVSEFDKKHLDHNNPGDLFDAPYHKEHMVASVIELLLIKELGIDLEEYDNRLEAL